jgi:hypothetical protein
MVIRVNKIRTAEDLDAILKKVKPVKKLDAKKYLGKVKWDEDPLEYQKRLRNEWY